MMYLIKKTNTFLFEKDQHEDHFNQSQNTFLVVKRGELFYTGIVIIFKDTYC